MKRALLFGLVACFATSSALAQSFQHVKTVKPKAAEEMTEIVPRVVVVTGEEEEPLATVGPKAVDTTITVPPKKAEQPATAAPKRTFSDTSYNPPAQSAGSPGTVPPSMVKAPANWDPYASSVTITADPCVAAPAVLGDDFTGKIVQVVTSDKTGPQFVLEDVKVIVVGGETFLAGKGIKRSEDDPLRQMDWYQGMSVRVKLSSVQMYFVMTPDELKALIKRYRPAPVEVPKGVPTDTPPAVHPYPNR